MSATARTFAVWIACALLLLALPQVFSSRTSLTLMNITGIWVVFALAYNMLLGQAGMLSFGHAVYFGLGGYAAIHLMAAIKVHKLGIPVALLPLVGFMAGALAGAIIGWFSCRRAGTPFAMISLGVGELIAASGLMFVSVFGGEEGISADRSAGPALFGQTLGPQINVYYFIAFWAFVAALAMWLFARTPLGRLSNALRDNPDRVAFIGYNPERVRWLVFLLSGGFAGLAGTLSAVNFEIITPEKLGAHNSGVVLLMTYIGGITVFYGPIIGAILLSLMQSMLSDFTKVWQLYLGLLFIVVVMFAPRGIGGVVAHMLGVIRRGELGGRLPVWLLGMAGSMFAFAGCVLVIEMGYRLREGGKVFAPFGHVFQQTLLTNWLLAFVAIASGIALIVVAMRWQRRGSLKAAMVLKEAMP